jgi:hypothetical protein
MLVAKMRRNLSCVLLGDSDVAPTADRSLNSTQENSFLRFGIFRACWRSGAFQKKQG